MENTTLRHRGRDDDEPSMPGNDRSTSKQRGDGSCSCPMLPLLLRPRASWIWMYLSKRPKLLFGLGLLSSLVFVGCQFIRGIQLSNAVLKEDNDNNDEGSYHQQPQLMWQQTCEASRSGNMHRPPSPPQSNNNNNNTHSLRHQPKLDTFKHNTSFPNKNETSSVVVCTIAIHELPYLTEWAEYNLHVLNVAKLFLYDNANTPELSNWNVDSVSIGREEGSGQNSTHNTNSDKNSRISIIHYPGSKQQGPAYKDCARRALSEGYEYAFFTDVDEFLVLYQHNSITELAVDYLGKGDDDDVRMEVEIDKDEKIIGGRHEHIDEEGKLEEPTTSTLSKLTTERNETRTVGSLGMNFRTLGNNCDIEYKDLPVSKRFQYRVEAAYPMNMYIKSLVKLKWLDLDVNFNDPHFYKLKKDDNGKEAVKIDTNRNVRGGSIHHMRLYDVAAVHHFLFKSLTEYIKKRERGGGTTGPSASLTEKAKRGIDNNGAPIPGGSIYDDEVWKRLVEKVPRYKKFDA